MAYAWLQKGVAYIVSTCWKTLMHDQPYILKYEDDFRNVAMKELPHLAVAQMLYEFLPLINEYNKQCQSALTLKKHWFIQHFLG